MIFQHTWEAILDGTKTQTSRVSKPSEYAWAQGHFIDAWGSTRPLYSEVCHASGRIKYRTGQVISVQPGRGKHGIAHVKIGALWARLPHEITIQDAIKEGFTGVTCESCEGTGIYASIYNSMYNHPISCPQCSGSGWQETPVHQFLTLWREMHGEAALNQRTWVIDELTLIQRK